MSDASVAREHVPCGKLATVLSRGVVASMQQVAAALGFPGRGHSCKGLSGKQLRVFLETVERGTVIASEKTSSPIG